MMRGQTMLGVAIPGIAPTQTGGGPPPSSALPMGPTSAHGGTMLGVAIPGIAPTAPGAAGALPPQSVSAAGVAPVRSRVGHTAIAQSPVLPAPAPFVDDVPVPRPPQRREKTGVPVPVVAAIVGGIVLVGGGAIALLARGSTPLVAQPRLDAQGNEVLHLQCENCADGTVASLGTAQVQFKSKEADLPLTKSLEVGDNKLTVKIDRPGSGRDEDVNLVVPVAFRIRADLADIGAKPPIITVRVGAQPGTEVSVDGKPVTLDATGKGAYAVDVSADTEGPTEDVRVVDRKIPYTVTMKGNKPESGTVSARIGVVPLRLDAPSIHAVTDKGSFTLAGQTVAGGAVTIDDKAATGQPDGSFADTRDAPALGATQTFELRATAPGRAPRTAHVTVKRVASLDAEAKDAEKGPLVTYDDIVPDIASKIGQRAVVAGEVLEARVTGHQTIALVNDARGCKRGPCLARVIAGEDVGLTRGQSVRAYGDVTRAVTASGKTVPEVEADFVVRGRR